MSADIIVLEMTKPNADAQVQNLRRQLRRLYKQWEFARELMEAGERVIEGTRAAIAATTTTPRQLRDAVRAITPSLAEYDELKASHGAKAVSK